MKHGLFSLCTCFLHIWFYRVFVFNWASPEFGKCWPVSNWFQKNIRVLDWPPIGIENVKVFGISPFSAAILRIFPKQGGPVEAFFGGGQSKDIFREGPVKKNHPVSWRTLSKAQQTQGLSSGHINQVLNGSKWVSEWVNWRVNDKHSQWSDPGPIKRSRPHVKGDNAWRSSEGEEEGRGTVC